MGPARPLGGGRRAIGAGGHWITERDKREGGQAEKRLREARTRLDGARRERDNLSRVRRGVPRARRPRHPAGRAPPRPDRAGGGLRKRHRLLALDYEIAPQRPLPGRHYASVDVLASRVKLKARALHEGDVLEFIEELSRSQRGLYPVDRCA